MCAVTLECAPGYSQEDPRKHGTPQVRRTDGLGGFYETTIVPRHSTLVCDGGMDYSSQYTFNNGSTLAYRFEGRSGYLNFRDKLHGQFAVF